MPDKIKDHPNEYRFALDGPFTKDTFPMAVLAEYLKDLAIIYGHADKLYFLRLDTGSAEAVASKVLSPSEIRLALNLKSSSERYR